MWEQSSIEVVFGVANQQKHPIISSRRILPRPVITYGLLFPFSLAVSPRYVPTLHNLTVTSSPAAQITCSDSIINSHLPGPLFQALFVQQYELGPRPSSLPTSPSLCTRDGPVTSPNLPVRSLLSLNLRHAGVRRTSPLSKIMYATSMSSAHFQCTTQCDIPAPIRRIPYE